MLWSGLFFLLLAVVTGLLLCWGQAPAGPELEMTVTVWGAAATSTRTPRTESIPFWKTGTVKATGWMSTFSWSDQRAYNTMDLRFQINIFPLRKKSKQNNLCLHRLSKVFFSQRHWHVWTLFTSRWACSLQDHRLLTKSGVRSDGGLSVEGDNRTIRLKQRLRDRPLRTALGRRGQMYVSSVLLSMPRSCTGWSFPCHAPYSPCR